MYIYINKIHTQVCTRPELVRLLKEKKNKHINILYFLLSSLCSSHALDFWLDLS